MSRTWRISAVAAAIVAMAAVVTPFLLRGAAAASGRSDVIAFRAAAIPPVFKDGIASSARSAGIPESTLVEVAPTGDATPRAGFVVGRGRAGDMVSFFTAHSFTNFRGIDDVSKHQELTIGASIQPDEAGNTGHVQLLGIAAPDITTARLDLRNGTKLTVELVKAGSAGYAFFTYVSDDPSTFPTVAHVFDATGAERQSRDLTLALAAPK
jgi:hypothetical protein